MARNCRRLTLVRARAPAFFCVAAERVQFALPNIDARNLLAIQSEKTNEVWCGTRGNGLRILLDPIVGPVVSELDSEQGLPSQNVFAVWPQRKADGTDVLLIGTNRGLARYEPGRLEPSLSPTRIVSKRVHTTAELQAGLNSRISAERSAARGRGDQQSHIS